MSITPLYVLFGDMSIQVLYPILNWIVCFLVLSFISSLYILYINPLLEVFMSMFSYYVGYLFIFLDHLICCAKMS